MISHFHRESRVLGVSLGDHIQLPRGYTQFMQFNVDRNTLSMAESRCKSKQYYFMHFALPRFPGLLCGETVWNLYHHTSLVCLDYR